MTEPRRVPCPRAMRVEQRFVNEHGREVRMSVAKERGEITVTASTVTSETAHTWTWVEATHLLEMLWRVVDQGE